MKFSYKHLSTMALAGALTLPSFANSEPASTTQEEVQRFTQVFDLNASHGISESSPKELDRHRRGQRRHNAHRRALQICKKIKATDEQKSQIAAAVLDYKAQAIDLDAAIKKAKLAYVRNIVNGSSELAIATDATNQGLEAKSGKLRAKAELVNKAMFDILTKEQRAPALKCLMAMKKARGKR